MSQPLYWLDTTTFGNSTPLTNSWVWYPFGFRSKTMVCIAPEYTNTDVVFFSIDGVNIVGRLNPQDSMVNLPNKRWIGVWLKGNSGSQNVRVWAY